ncbi:CinA family protein [Sinimarinibacterium sp. NLF-5-8]|uniref:CinA family protein n=1 Tax=Sinimarinibacterium sp. NLF-5-8 TaxID=2698684 RepID=UPI00137C18E2|nr:CinA family protein [Sinimarinibacterium sp. NLF-5-8]QHS09616.1 CinA family protein [Sinimarinibacterium sp. NLF-5-8]
MTNSANLLRLAEQLSARSQTLAVAESCTGGLLAQLLTARAGASAWFECGLVTYSNRAKHIVLGVPETTLSTYGAVSQQTALAMVRGTLERIGTDWALSITGIAGPGGGSAEKPVGTVWIACGHADAEAHAVEHHFVGDREAIRRQSAAAAIELVLQRLHLAAN